MTDVDRGPAGYTTRGRARELFQRMDELEQRVDRELARMDLVLEQAIAFELELARRRIGAELGLVRSYELIVRGEKSRGADEPAD